MTRQRGAVWRTANYFGLVSDAPKPKVGSAAWWRFAALLAVAIAGSRLVVELL